MKNKNNMVGKLSDKYKEYFFLMLVFCTALVFFLYNLDNQYLWQDEAENALVSKTILTYGVPKGFDGKNYFSQEADASYDKDYLWTLDPWLPYYLVALFFKVFGVNTFTARLPFALFGIATIIMTYFFAKSLTRDKKIATVATVLLLLSVPFIILSRQSRYYSLVAFLSIFGLYGYLILLEKRKIGSAIFLLSAILIFHCHHLFCAILLVTIFTHTLLCYRQQLVKVFVLSMIVALTSLPWLLWVSGKSYTNIFGYSFLDKSFFWYLKEYILGIHYYIFPFFLLLIPVCKGVFLWTKQKNIKSIFLKDSLLWKNLLLLFLFTFFTILPLSVTSPLPYFRYLIQLIPVFCIITAIIVTSALKTHFKPAIIITATLLGLIFFADYRYGKAYPDREGIKYLNIFDYIDEITHDYDGPIEGIVRYLNKYGSKDDVVAITYGDLPLKFYTQMRVVGGFTGEDLSPAKQANWVILRKYTIDSIGEKDAEVRKYLIQNLPSPEHYERITIDYPDIAFENREDPESHHFRTVVNEEKVVIFHKIK